MGASCGPPNSRPPSMKETIIECTGDALLFSKEAFASIRLAKSYNPSSAESNYFAPTSRPKVNKVVDLSIELIFIEFVNQESNRTLTPADKPDTNQLKF